MCLLALRSHFTKRGFDASILQYIFKCDLRKYSPSFLLADIVNNYNKNLLVIPDTKITSTDIQTHLPFVTDETPIVAQTPAFSAVHSKARSSSLMVKDIGISLVNFLLLPAIQASRNFLQLSYFMDLVMPLFLQRFARNLPRFFLPAELV